MKKIIEASMISVFTLLMVFLNQPTAQIPQNTTPDIISETVEVDAVEYTSGPAEQFIEVKTLVKEKKSSQLSYDDVELIALVTMAEAEAESVKGQRLVIDTILNRVESEHFPDTVKGVIYQENQFTSMHNGRVDRCYVKEELCQLVKEEMESRSNTEVMFFGANNYSQYGVPMFKEGGHYFSSYD